MKTVLLSNQMGFTLIEALISIALIGIGFSGMYMLITVSEKSLLNNMTREELTYLANQVFEGIEIDRANLNSYRALAVTSTNGGGCANSASNFINYWCSRLNTQFGQIQPGDTMTISITNTNNTNTNNSANNITVTLTYGGGTSNLVFSRIMR